MRGSSSAARRAWSSAAAKPVFADGRVTAGENRGICLGRGPLRGSDGRDG